MIDYKLKQSVLESGLCNYEKDLSRKIHFLYGEYEACLKKYFACTPIEFFHYSEQLALIKRKLSEVEKEYASMCQDDLWKEAQRINNAQYARTRRLKKRIKNMLLSGTCFFLTLTFTNKCLRSTSAETRRRYVTQTLRDMNCIDYIANLDFGKKNGREHYHALVQIERINSSYWTFGNLDFEKCGSSDKDCEKLAKYTSKLTNHALKIQGLRQFLIYKRKNKNV